MKITIDRIKNHPETIPYLSQLWCELFAKQWLPAITKEEAEKQFRAYLHEEVLPLCLVAFDGNKPVGFCCFKTQEKGIRPDLTPWLGPLVVDTHYQKRGIGTCLITAIKTYAKEIDYHKIYLVTLDKMLPLWYEKQGWRVISIEEFRGYKGTLMEVDL